MIKVAVVGAAGRMGRRFVANICASDDMELSGALEIESSPFIGQDAGSVAACGECGVKISAEPEAVYAHSDAVINFSTAGVLESTKIALKYGCKVVIGTTTLTADEKVELKELAQKGAIVFAPNMSIGVNLLFYLSRKAAEILNEDFDIEVVEMHHNLKKDAPSGTAVRLGEILCEARGLDYDKDVRHGREGLVGERTKQEIGMHALRGGDVVGDHTVIFAANGERVELTHKASSRDTFARGALQAVRFLMDKKSGMYDMQDVLNLK